MYPNVIAYANDCPQCAIVEDTGRRQKPQRTSLPVDITELPVASKGIDIYI